MGVNLNNDTENKLFIIVKRSALGVKRFVLSVKR